MSIPPKGRNLLDPGIIANEMKKERTLNEMYQLVLHKIQPDQHKGLCNIMYDLMSCRQITYNEYERLYQHFKSQRPRKRFFGLISINRQFLKHPLYEGKTWWWRYDSDILTQQEQRKLFIEHLIKKTKPKGSISVLEVVNMLFFQWFFVRLTRCQERRVNAIAIHSVSIVANGQIEIDGNIFDQITYNWYSVQYWILPCTGWEGKFISLNKEPRFTRVTKKRIVND